MKNIKVSIIIPVYNVELYLKKCLNSALNQTLNEIEIIAVNDGSTDTSLAILEEYQQKDNRINIITQDNQGLSGARNTGIKAAKGDYLLFLDSDDYIDENMAFDMYERAIREKSDVVVCRYQQVDDEGNILYKSGITDTFNKEQHFKRVLAAQSSSMACDKLFKRSLFVNNDILFPLGLYHEDVYTTYKLYYYANNICVEEKYFYNWLVRQGSISKSINEKHIKDFRKILLDTKQFLKDKNCFKKYESEYTRRALHYLFGLANRINSSSLDDDNKKILRGKVWRIVEELQLNTDNGLKNIKKIDKNLYLKLKSKIEFSSKKRKDMRDIVDKLLPKGTLRREVIKKIVYGKSYEPFLVPAVQEQKRQVNSKTKKPMLNVLESITEEEVNNLKQFKDKFKGKRCFIVGNGPSLNKCDLSLLKDEYTFAVNGIFYKTEEMGFKPTFYMVEDGHVVDDNLAKINEYDPQYKFFPSLYKNKIVKTENTYFFSADLGFYRGDHYSFEIPRFSRDFSQVSFCGQSVTYLNMQLAFYMGFSEVYLIGMDFSYAIRESDEKRGATLITHDEDVNHFHPDYFGKGKKWHDPKVHNVAKNYEFAKIVYEDNNRKIYNATIGGKLEIFERVDYDSLFKK